MSETKKKPILCIDFDGVIHRYSKGWQDGAIYDVVTSGFFTWAERAKDIFTLVIYSSRSKTAEGLSAMSEWLTEQMIDFYGDTARSDDPPLTPSDFSFASEKPPAFLTIDDRAIRFEGSWVDITIDPERLLAFRPWNAETSL